jgi:hypothetical protein
MASIRSTQLARLLSHLVDGDQFFDVQLPQEQAMETGWRLRALQRNVNQAINDCLLIMSRIERRVAEARHMLARGYNTDSNVLHTDSEDLARAMTKLSGLEDMAELLLDLVYPEKVALWVEYSAGQAVDSEQVGRETARAVAEQEARKASRRGRR